MLDKQKEVFEQYCRDVKKDDNATALYNIGTCYSHGEGVKQDDVKAAYYYGLAAEKGDSSAKAALGRRYMAGKGVPKDLYKARELFRAALADPSFKLSQDAFAKSCKADLEELENKAELNIDANKKSKNFDFFKNNKQVKPQQNRSELLRRKEELLKRKGELLRKKVELKKKKSQGSGSQFSNDLQTEQQITVELSTINSDLQKLDLDLDTTSNMPPSDGSQYHSSISDNSSYNFPEQTYSDQSFAQQNYESPAPAPAPSDCGGGDCGGGDCGGDC
jgi:hypothetical protein